MAAPFNPPPDHSARGMVVAAHRYLKANRVVNPDWQAELIVGTILNQPRFELYLSGEREISGAEMARIRDALTRRANGEPTQYILGRTEFYGLPFKCDRRALIPRPETELLVEHALTALRELERPAPRVLDLGTGSGCIAVAIAVNAAHARVTASDTAEEALALAGENAKLNAVSDRLELIRSDLFAGITGTFDLIVANLPYVSELERDALMKEVRDFEPPEALYSGPDGLALVGPAVDRAHQYLERGGVLLMEIGYDQADSVRAMAERAGVYANVALLPDYQGHLRVLSARKI